MIAVEYK